MKYALQESKLWKLNPLRTCGIMRKCYVIGKRRQNIYVFYRILDKSEVY